MDRRTFLSLLASAPIAALAPWPNFLPKKRRLPIGHPSCHCMYCVIHRQYVSGKMSEMGGFDWYADADVVYSSSEVAVDMPAEQARLAEALADAIDTAGGSAE